MNERTQAMRIGRLAGSRKFVLAMGCVAVVLLVGLTALLSRPQAEVTDSPIMMTTATPSSSPTRIEAALASTPVTATPERETPQSPSSPDNTVAKTVIEPTRAAPTPTSTEPMPSTITPTPTPQPTSMEPDQPVQEPASIPQVNAATLRLVIPSIEINAAVQIKEIDPNGVMQSPDGPEAAAWYDFSSDPGGDGNTVFSGHRDYAGYGPAVFWRLGELQPGDVIEVHQQDGAHFQYRVTAVQLLDATSSANAVVESTGSPTITLITCDGLFDSSNRSYDQRLVVTGERID